MIEAFGVRVQLVEPGYCPDTRFTENGGARMEGLIPEAYAPFAKPIFAAFAKPAAVTTASDVAEGVWRAANDETGTLRSLPVPTPQRWLGRPWLRHDADGPAGEPLAA